MKNNASYFFDLLWEMTLRELKIRYKNTSLGFLWGIIYPVLQAVIIGFIFQFLFKVPDKNYQYSLFLNLLIWNFFSGSLENATQSIVQNRTIIKKAKFPYAVIPLSIVFCNALHLTFSLLLFCIFVSIFHITIGINIFILIIGFVLLVLFTASLSLASSSLNVRNRDVGFLTRAALMIWFYATPVVYSITKIPSNIQYLWYFNPLTEIVMFFQSSFFQTEISPLFIFSNSLLIIGVIILGIFLFRKREDNFGDYI